MTAQNNPDMVYTDKKVFETDGINTTDAVGFKTAAENGGFTMNNRDYQELYEYSGTVPVVSTHSHHRPDKSHTGLTLAKVLEDSYVNWCLEPIPKNAGEADAWLSKVRYRSYFVWLQKAMQKLFGIEEPLSSATWDRYDACIRQAHQDPKWQLDVLARECGYTDIIVDTFWNPGDDNGHPELFRPTFRINSFLFGYDRAARDHNGNNALVLYGDGRGFTTVREYMEFVSTQIERKKEEGCVALKSALAYDRGLWFAEPDETMADRVFQSPGKEEILAFQNYVFHGICEIAAECDLPLQLHTGLATLNQTSAGAMRGVIEAHPHTRFILFHGSYPWTDDFLGLVHNCANVYPDLCWLPIISTSCAARTLDELIEVGNGDRICWGCDTWTSEESYGALLAMRHVLAKVLAEKISDGYLELSDARELIKLILGKNARILYRLDR